MGALRDLPVQQEADDALPVGHLPDLGAFRLGGQRLDAAHGGLDLVLRTTHVGAVLQLDHHGGAAFGRDGHHRVDIIQRANLLFDAEQQRLLDLFRRPAPGYATVISTASNVMEGNASCTRPLSEKSPAPTMRSASRLAATRLRTM